MDFADVHEEAVAIQHRSQLETLRVSFSQDPARSFSDNNNPDCRQAANDSDWLQVGVSFFCGYTFFGGFKGFKGKPKKPPPFLCAVLVPCQIRQGGLYACHPGPVDAAS